MSKKIIMWEKTYNELKRQLMALYNRGISWPQLKDATKEECLRRINATLGRTFTTKDIDYIWGDINLHTYKHTVIVDKKTNCESER